MKLPNDKTKISDVNIRGIAEELCHDVDFVAKLYDYIITNYEIDQDKINIWEELPNVLSEINATENERQSFALGYAIHAVLATREND